MGFKMNTPQLLNWVQTIISFLSLIFIGMQIYLLRNQLRNYIKQEDKQNLWKQMDSTFNYLDKDPINMNRISTSTLDELELIRLSSSEMPIESIKKFLEDQNKRKELFLIAQYYERLAIGIKCGYYNEELVKKYAYYAIIRTYDNL